jgi:hypothetical protein
VRGGLLVSHVEVDNPAWIGMAKRIDTLVIVASDEQHGSGRGQLRNELLVAGVKVLELVHD